MRKENEGPEWNWKTWHMWERFEPFSNLLNPFDDLFDASAEALGGYVRRNAHRQPAIGFSCRSQSGRTEYGCGVFLDQDYKQVEIDSDLTFTFRLIAWTDTPDQGKVTQWVDLAASQPLGQIQANIFSLLRQAYQMMWEYDRPCPVAPLPWDEAPGESGLTGDEGRGTNPEDQTTPR